MGQRWIIINKVTRKPVTKTSFADKWIAEGFRCEGEEVIPANLVGKSGPFSDYLAPEDGPLAREEEYGLGYMQGRGAS
jgi:hypothetical protein